jgi:hypothetical protein
VADNLSREELRRLAKLGAHLRLDELDSERRAVHAAFPDLATAARRTRRQPAAKPAPAARAEKPAPKRRTMSAAQRKAVSERMKKYWAERRKAKAARANK